MSKIYRDGVGIFDLQFYVYSGVLSMRFIYKKQEDLKAALRSSLL